MRLKHALLALAPLLLILPTTAEAAGGTASFSPFINWQYGPNLYFNVNGAPASVCGDVYVSRNGGSYNPLYGWICTDGAGNASKGPWTWANQNGDEDAYAYVAWPNGTYTNLTRHIWDKTAPSITIDPFNVTWPNTPTSFTGSANDGSYGAGFKANFGQESGVVYANGSRCYVQFRNVSTGLYWCPGANTYNSSAACTVSCTISGMPSRTVTWAASQVPPGYAHNPLETHQWKVIIYDNYELGNRAEKNAPVF